MKIVFIELVLAILTLGAFAAVWQSSSRQAKIAWCALSMVLVVLMILAWIANLSVVLIEVSTT